MFKKIHVPSKILRALHGRPLAMMNTRLSVLLLCPIALHAAGTRKDLFEGVFGPPTFSQREEIRKNSHRTIGYRITLRLPSAGDDWDRYRRSLQKILESRLVAEGYKIVLSRAIILDSDQPFSCNIVAERAEKKLFVHCLAFEERNVACYITYEVEDDV